MSEHTPKGSIETKSKDASDHTEITGISLGAFTNNPLQRMKSGVNSDSQSSGLLSTQLQLLELELGKSLAVEIPQNNTDLSVIIRKRLEGIDLEM